MVRRLSRRSKRVVLRHKATAELGALRVFTPGDAGGLFSEAHSMICGASAYWTSTRRKLLQADERTNIIMQESIRFLD